MTKTQTRKFAALAGILVSVAVLASLILTISVHADTRDSRSDRNSGHTVEAQPTPAPTPTTPPPTLPPPPPGGGITNVTTGEVNSGGNTGGTVVTGDEHVDVTVVNVGPVNNTPPPVVVPAPEPTPEPACDRRSTNCSNDNAGRTR